MLFTLENCVQCVLILFFPGPSPTPPIQIHFNSSHIPNLMLSLFFERSPELHVCSYTCGHPQECHYQGPVTP